MNAAKIFPCSRNVGNLADFLTDKKGYRRGVALAVLAVGLVLNGISPAAISGADEPACPRTVKLLSAGEETVRIVCFGDSLTGVYYHTGGRRAYSDMLGIALKKITPRATGVGLHRYCAFGRERRSHAASKGARRSGVPADPRAGSRRSGPKTRRRSCRNRYTAGVVAATAGLELRRRALTGDRVAALRYGCNQIAGFL